MAEGVCEPSMTTSASSKAALPHSSNVSSARTQNRVDRGAVSTPLALITVESPLPSQLLRCINKYQTLVGSAQWRRRRNEDALDQNPFSRLDDLNIFKPAVGSEVIGRTGYRRTLAKLHYVAALAAQDPTHQGGRN